VKSISQIKKLLFDSLLNSLMGVVTCILATTKFFSVVCRTCHTHIFSCELGRTGHILLLVSITKLYKIIHNVMN